MTDIIGGINLFSGVSQILLGLVVFFSDFRDKVKRVYFLSVLFLGAWSLSIYFYSNPILFDATIWLKIVYTMAYCMTLGLILFARVYPKEERKKFSVFLILVLIYMLIMGIILWSTDYIVVSAYHYPGSYNSIAVMGPLYFFYGLPEFITAFYVVIYYIKQSGVLEGIQKNQVQFYVAGGIIMLIPVFVFDFMFPLFGGNTSFYKYSTLGNTAWTAIVGYSILTTRFLDVRIVLGSILTFFLKSFSLLLILLLVIFGIVPLWKISLDPIGILKLSTISIPLTLFVYKIFENIDRFISDHFVYVKYHPVKTLREFSSRNANTVRLGSIVNNLLKVISDSLKTNFVYIVLLDSNKQLIVNKVNGSRLIHTLKITEILEVWNKLNSNRILIYSELKHDKRAGKRIIDEKRFSILRFMEENKIEIIFSLKEVGKFSGAVLIGQKKDRNSYTTGDIEFLDSLMQSAQLSLARAFLYLELQTFNQTLQDKVNEQTKELQVKIVELEEARRKENDMIDIMGHELRTPATIVKLNASFLNKFVDEIKSNPDSYKKYVGRIEDAVENEIKLINTLLSSAKLEGDKIEINAEEVDIQEEVEMALHGVENDAKVKGLGLINRVDSKTPNVYADKARIVEVLNNLLSNAIKYTDKGGVGIVSAYDKDFVKISVTDTGRGIPAEDISKLGQKFYRVNNYIESGKNDKVNVIRPGGTGLGLYVTFNLIRKMGGEVTVASEVGNGTTFTFTIPRFKGQTAKLKPSSFNMFDKLGLRK